MAACIAKVPPEQRKLVTTHDALGYYADRYGIDVVGAVIPSLSTRGQPSAGEVADLVRTIREQDVKAIFAESSVNAKVEQAIARETGAVVGRPLWADTLGPPGSDGATYVDSITSQHAGAGRGLHRRADDAAMFDAFEAPFMQRALVESLLLAALAGVLGSWIVLRRLAFFTHGVGTAAFPGLVLAGPAGVAPQLTAAAAALVYAGGVEGLRRRRVAADAATGLVLVGALALGVVLASDVYETGAGVDRLLFGSLIGISDRDLWLTAGVAAAVVLLEAVVRRSWLAQGFDPVTARALGVRPALADALLLAAVAGRGDRGARRGRRAAGHRRARDPGRHRAARGAERGRAAGRDGAAGRGRGRRGAVAGLRAQRRARAGDRRARRGRLRARGGAAMRVAGLGGGYAPGADVLTGVDFALEPGTIAAVLGPNGGGKTTLFRALLDELPERRGTVELEGRPAYVPQTDRTRLDFPVSALDVVLMGAYGRTPAWRPLARADRDAARDALDRVGLADRARKRFGALSGGQRQRVLIARALLQDSRVLLLDEPLSGVDAASATRIEALFAELRGRGPHPAGGHPRRRAGAALGPRRLPARRADRLRRAGRRSHHRRAAADLRA